MTAISWQIFKAKFAGKEEDAFQELCLHVFCHYCGLKGGVFSYKNHAGTETEDVLYQGKHTGFQAKFYTDNLPQKKQKIIDAILTTRSHNSRVQKIIFFLPIDPPCFTKGIDEGQKPQWMQEAETTAAQNGLEIEWFGTARFQVVFACEELQFIARHYFEQKADLWDFVAGLRSMTDARLSFIRNTISFHGNDIHIEHTYELEHLDKSNPQTITLISGIGGVGKTAIVKDWIARNETNQTCVIVLQPNDVIEQFRDVDMSKSWHATLKDFFKMTLATYANRILVVDSAEKMGKDKELSELLMVLHRFLGADWKIILTARTLFEKQIVLHFQTFLPDMRVEVLNVRPISSDELESLSLSYNFDLPKNTQIRDAIRCPFNLSAYLSCKHSNTANSLQAFQDSVWLHSVQNDDPADTAGQTLCNYVEEKLRNDAHFLNIDSPSEDTKQLVKRGIIAPRENGTGYVITHDVYEEWAAVRVLNGKLQELGFPRFEKYIVTSHGLRHGLQLQVEQRIASMGKDADPLLTSLLATNNDALQSDFLLALVRSESIGKFLKIYSKTLLAKDTSILERIIAATYNFGRGPEKNALLFPRKRPEGIAWPTIIQFSFSHQLALQEIETPTLLLLMQDWVLSNPKDVAAYTCSLFAWKAITISAPRHAYSYQWQIKLADLILSTSACDKKKFEMQIRRHLAMPPDQQNAVLDKVCRRLLLESMSGPGFVAIQNCPKLTRDIALAYWRVKHHPHNQCYDLDSIESEYGLSKYDFKYFPPSPYQGPTYLLLKADLVETIVFIIDFVNTCIADADKSDSQRFDRIALIMPEGKKIEQKISLGLWNCYRDKGCGEHVPYLLKAMHMALEKYLLELTEDRANDELCEGILSLLLCRSKSASLTAVVASIVMAHPMEFVKIGLILISERKIFLCDLQRHVAEQAPDIANIILPFPKQLHDYFRDEADKHPVRKVNLENVIWQYQLVPSKVVPNLKERVHKIIDGFATGWDDLPLRDKFWLTRIDVRRQNLQTTVDNERKQMLISGEPILSKDMLERQEETRAFSTDMNRVLKLSQWGENRIRGHSSPPRDEYGDIRNVLKDFFWLADKADSLGNELDVLRISTLRITAAALIMFHSGELTNTLFSICERTLIDSLNIVFDDSFLPAGREHVNVAISAIPYLLPRLGWWKRWYVRQRFVMSLLNEDENGLFGGDRICDWGMAGIRGYCIRTGDKCFLKWSMKAFRHHFLHYQSYVRYLRTPSAGPLHWKIRVAFCKILKRARVRIPSWLQNHEWMASRHRLAYHHSLCAYLDSFVARHWLLAQSTEKDVAHCACNAIGFYFPTKLDTVSEHEIISNVKRVLEFLFCDEQKDVYRREHLYLSQMGRAYMRHLGYCALNMSPNGCMALLGEFEKVPRAFQRPELLDKCLGVQYEQNRAESFWRLWNGLLPIVATALAKSSCNHYDNQQALDVMALNPLYWEGNEGTWDGADTAILTYFDSLVRQCGNHRHLAVSVIKFACGVGKRFLFPSLRWINNILLQSQHEYDYGGGNANNIKTHFEKLIPLIEKRMVEIQLDIEIRRHLISILDYLVTLNSLPAFRLRESLYNSLQI